MQLSQRAQDFEGKTVELTRSGIGVGAWINGEHVIVRRTEAGERGTIVRVTDAGFNGLQFRVRLEAGDAINAYEADVRVVG